MSTMVDQVHNVMVEAVSEMSTGVDVFVFKIHIYVETVRKMSIEVDLQQTPYLLCHKQ